MAESKSLPINPGKGLGFLVLGASLYDVFSRLKAEPSLYPSIQISYSSRYPLQEPVFVELPENGLRLRFDGADQRLRLIEILTFGKMPITYKGAELVKSSEGGAERLSPTGSATGPSFRHVYHKLFGPTFAGEYYGPSGKANRRDSRAFESDYPQPPEQGNSEYGTYILSYPGVAFSFAVQNNAWSPDKDFVSLLSSNSTLPAHALAIFNGTSWTEARHDFFSRPCPHPRALAFTGRNRDTNPDEIELVRIKGHGHIDFVRRNLPNFSLVLGETSLQDLVSQLGPPNAIHRKYDRKMSIHKNRTSSRSNHPPFASGSPGQVDGYSDTDRSSTHTDYSSPEDETVAEGLITSSTECFYNYFNHGLDVFISYPPDRRNATKSDGTIERAHPLANAGQLVATKLILHGNIPGSYEFNKYRRSRWALDWNTNDVTSFAVTSESSFSEASRSLEDVWRDSGLPEEEKRALRIPMILNRDWGDSPASSFDFADLRSSNGAGTAGEMKETVMGTTRLYGFPGFLLEVLRNDVIGCVTIY